MQPVEAAPSTAVVLNLFGPRDWFCWKNISKDQQGGGEFSLWQPRVRASATRALLLPAVKSNYYELLNGAIARLLQIELQVRSQCLNACLLSEQGFFLMQDALKMLKAMLFTSAGE